MTDQEDKVISNDIQDLPIAADERPDRRKGSGNRSPRKKTTDSSTNKGSGVLVWLFCLGLLGVVVFEYWQINEVRTALDQTRAELKAAKKVLSNVTGEISATGENLNQSDSALRSELKTVNSEIRKLWDLSNKRNRKDISDNEKRLDQLEKKADNIVAQAGKASSAVGQMKAKVTELESLLKAVNTEQVASKSEMMASLESLRSQLNKLDQLTAEQKKLQSGTEKSVDNFRVQVNRKLLQLESSLREMKQPVEQGL